LAVHGYAYGRREAETHLAAFYAEHSDGHLIANLHGLAWTSAENEHGYPP
jgi:hypothetical protein